jgi:hypothetical protein
MIRRPLSSSRPQRPRWDICHHVSAAVLPLLFFPCCSSPAALPLLFFPCCSFHGHSPVAMSARTLVASSSNQRCQAPYMSLLVVIICLQTLQFSTCLELESWLPGTTDLRWQSWQRWSCVTLKSGANWGCCCGWCLGLRAAAMQLW